MRILLRETTSNSQETFQEQNADNLLQNMAKGAVSCEGPRKASFSSVVNQTAIQCHGEK